MVRGRFVDFASSEENKCDHIRNLTITHPSRSSVELPSYWLILIDNERIVLLHLALASNDTLKEVSTSAPARLPQ